MAVKNRPTPEAGPREKTRVAGLDAIRLLCALWVMIGHSGFPLLLTEFSHGRLRAVDGLLRTLINGPAAVIVFFVISGFCIHFPYREGKGKQSLASFYTRRLLRITLPYVIAELLAHLAGIDLGGIAWSLVAEAIYYLFYPLFLQLRVRYGWPRLIIAAYIMAVAVILTRPNAGNYPSFTNALNWVVGMPCWFLGCLLAEQWQKIRVAAPLHLWGWRDGIIVLSFMASVLRWHVPHLSIGNPWTLDAFAIPVYFWLGREISYYQTRQPIQWLEKSRGSELLALLGASDWHDRYGYAADANGDNALVHDEYFACFCSYLRVDNSFLLCGGETLASSGGTLGEDGPSTI